MAGDLATEDDGDLIRPTDGAIGIEQALAESVQCGAPMEDEIVAISTCEKKQPVPAGGVLPLPSGEEGSERQPLLTTGHQIPRGQRVGELLKASRSAHRRMALEVCLKPIPSCQAVGQPVVLIETHPGGERRYGQTRTNIRPQPVIDVEVVLR